MALSALPTVSSPGGPVWPGTVLGTDPGSIIGLCPTQSQDQVMLETTGTF